MQWYVQEQRMDIGGMETIFVVMGERKMCNEQIPLPYIKAYRKALRDVVDWLERHEQQMKAYKLTTGKDYMAFLRMFRDDPDSLMEMGGFADEYRVADECKDKVKKVIEKGKEKNGLSELQLLLAWFYVLFLVLVALRWLAQSRIVRSRFGLKILMGRMKRHSLLMKILV